MKIKLLIIILLSGFVLHAQQIPVVIYNATIHVGNGTIINDGMIVIRNAVIEYIGPKKELDFNMNDVSSIDAAGKQVYPGLIALNSTVGLKEIEAARATNDFYEIGSYNSNVRSLIAFNTDSKVIPTLRTNGVLLAQVVPDAGIIQGQSSVMKMSGWNWEDAVVATDNNMHMHWPSAYRYDYQNQTIVTSNTYSKEVDDITTFFNEAKSYGATKDHAVKNLRFEAMRKVFTGESRLFISANEAKEIIGAIDFAKSFGLKIVIVGGRESYRVTDLLKENNIPVLLESTHELPGTDDDAVDLPYRLPALLTNAGILCGLTVCNEGSSYWNVRNLPFEAGTACAYGLTKEQALTMITMNNAVIAGISGSYGTLETGKSATLFICDGDVLDMRTSELRYIFINGERIGIENWQNELARKFMLKYSIIK